MNQRVRIGSVAFSIENISTFDHFVEKITQHLTFAAESGCKFVVFPEYLTVPLLAIQNDWDYWTDRYKELFATLSKKRDIFILAGSHIVNKTTNTAFFFSPNSTVITQDKWHLTPFEKQIYPLKPGNSTALIKTEFGNIAIAICYDVEFPEFVRSLSGADILVVPSCTEDAQGFWRVRHSAAARSVENQIAVVHAPLVGNFSSLPDFEKNVGKAAILVPSDIGFPAAGIAAEGEWNKNSCVIAEVDVAKIRDNREHGSVTPPKDLRLKDYGRQHTFFSAN